MEWTDQGVVLTSHKHGETSAIVEVLTQDHGRHTGVVRGGASRKMAATLQPGTQVDVTWRARLEEHIGAFRIEPVLSRAFVLNDRTALAGLSSICALVCFGFPERMALPDLYHRTIWLLDQLDTPDEWPKSYALWELAVLENLGYGLDLSQCAATGRQDDLVYVSPKSGRAVSAGAGAPYADRLLPLPEFLRSPDKVANLESLRQALQTTGYFLQNTLAPALGRPQLPEARNRLIRYLLSD